MEVKSQDVLLEEVVFADSADPSFGPNYKNYSHFYIGFGIVAGKSITGSQIKYGYSTEKSLGLRFKRKLNNVFSLGFNISYSHTQFHLSQDSTKTLPNNLLHDKERINFHNLYLGIYQRINWGKRGNYVGNFIDFGGRLYWPFAINHVTKDQLPANHLNNGRMAKVKTSNLAYANPYNYCAVIRIGLNRYVFSASYRLSPLFKNDPKLFSQYNSEIEKYEDLPLIIVGIEIGMHK